MSATWTGQEATERGRVVEGGMGSFLCPPGHPEHSLHVEYELRRRAENRGAMALSAATTTTWLTADTREAAQRALDAWEQPALAGDGVHAWVLSVLGYYRGCYRGDGPEPECWQVQRMRYSRPQVDPDDADNVVAWDRHAGVHRIRAYYPQYQPSAADFAQARWGSA